MEMRLRRGLPATGGEQRLSRLRHRSPAGPSRRPGAAAGTRSRRLPGAAEAPGRDAGHGLMGSPLAFSGHPALLYASSCPARAISVARSFVASAAFTCEATSLTLSA